LAENKGFGWEFNYDIDSILDDQIKLDSKIFISEGWDKNSFFCIAIPPYISRLDETYCIAKYYNNWIGTNCNNLQGSSLHNK
jgi:hypothetical protein